VNRADDRPSLRRAIARFAAGGAGLVGARLELASIELAQERERLLLRIALLAAGILALLFGLLAIGAFVVLHFWESGRVPAILAVAAAFLVLGVVLVVVVARMGRRGASPFEATLAEFHKDAALLREILGREERGSDGP
jgi:uncharacterized membrane protein YqjE